MLAQLFGAMALAFAMLSDASAARHSATADQAIMLDGFGGVLETESGHYLFTPTVCAIVIEDGEYDIEIYGPGIDVDGRDIFFELSSTARHLSVGFDITSVFARADEELVARDFDFEVSGTEITVRDVALTDQDGTRVGLGSLLVDCEASP